MEEGEVIEGFDQEDEYQLEELEVSEADFMKADSSIGLVEFRRQWEVPHYCHTLVSLPLNCCYNVVSQLSHCYYTQAHTLVTVQALGNTNEVVKKYSLGLDGLQAAVDAVLDLLGMGACEGSNVVADDARSHAVNLAGFFLEAPTPLPVLARAGVMMVQGKGVTLKISVRSENAELNTTLCGAIR